MSASDAPRRRRRDLALAEQAQLDLADIVELAGLEADVVRGIFEQWNFHPPCSPSALVGFYEQSDRRADLSLPKEFVEAVLIRARDDRWRDELIAELTARGLAGTTIDYASFLAITTFAVDGTEHVAHVGHDDAWYALRRDDVGTVIGIEAGPVLRGTNMEGEYQRSAHFEFRATLEDLVRWVRDQGGNVQLKADNVDELARLLPGGGVAQRASRRRRREDLMTLEIANALRVNAHADSTEVMAWLKTQTGKKGSCITEVVGDVVHWKNSAGDPEELTMPTLKKRLRRLRQPKASR